MIKTYQNISNHPLIFWVLWVESAIRYYRMGYNQQFLGLGHLKFPEHCPNSTQVLENPAFRQQSWPDPHRICLKAEEWLKGASF